MAGSSHGHTPAAWTGVIISFIGFCIAGVFMVAANPLGFWAGIAVIFIGGLVGLAMKAMRPRHAEGVGRDGRSQGAGRTGPGLLLTPVGPIVRGAARTGLRLSV